jgi:hypothetical protein
MGTSKNSDAISGKIFIYFSITFFCLYILNVLLGMLSVRYAINFLGNNSYLGVLGESALLFGTVLFAIIFMLHNEPVKD